MLNWHFALEYTGEIARKVLAIYHWMRKNSLFFFYSFHILFFLLYRHWADPNCYFCYIHVWGSKTKNRIKRNNIVVNENRWEILLLLKRIFLISSSFCWIRRTLPTTTKMNFVEKWGEKKFLSCCAYENEDYRLREKSSLVVSWMMKILPSRSWIYNLHTWINH